MKKNFNVLRHFLHLSLYLTLLFWCGSLLAYDTLPTPSSTTSSKTTIPIEAQPTTLIPTPPSTNAKSYVLADINSGEIIASLNADEQMEPASLTKMMTMYVVSDALKRGTINLDDEVRISVKAWKTGGSRMFIKEGQKVPVSELIKGIIIDSGNDACVALAEHIAGSEEGFVDLMNQQAQLLGMNATHFVDSTGMPDPNHYTTAMDMTILARALIQHFPDEYKWYKQKQFTYNDIKQYNRNRLLWRDPAVDGIKTGHTESAGYNLVASAKKKDMRLISVVLGASSEDKRSDDSQHLLNYGFRFFNTHRLYEAGEALGKTRVFKGENKETPVGLTQDIYVTIPAGQYKQLKAFMEFDKTIIAPIQEGQVLGNITVKQKNDIIAKQPLIALQNNPRGGLWTRTKDSTVMLFQRWFSSDDENNNENNNNLTS